MAGRHSPELDASATFGDGADDLSHLGVQAVTGRLRRRTDDAVEIHELVHRYRSPFLIRMEPLWSPVVATGRNRSQMRSPQKRQKQAETVCRGLRW